MEPQRGIVTRAEPSDRNRGPYRRARRVRTSVIGIIRLVGSSNSAAEARLARFRLNSNCTAQLKEVAGVFAINSRGSRLRVAFYCLGSESSLAETKLPNAPITKRRIACRL